MCGYKACGVWQNTREVLGDARRVVEYDRSHERRRISKHTPPVLPKGQIFSPLVFSFDFPFFQVFVILDVDPTDGVVTKEELDILSHDVREPLFLLH